MRKVFECNSERNSRMLYRPKVRDHVIDSATLNVYKHSEKRWSKNVRVKLLPRNTKINGTLEKSAIFDCLNVDAKDLRVLKTCALIILEKQTPSTNLTSDKINKIIE